MLKAFFLVVLGLMPLPAGAAPEAHSIIVSGFSEKMIEPNLLSFQIEVWSEAETAKVAQQKTASEFQRVKGVLEKFKIKKEDMGSVGYAVNPTSIYDQKEQQNKITGYRVSQTLAVTLRKTSDAGTLLDGLSSDKKDTKNGVNINNIQWDSDQKTAAENAGLQEAVKEARRRAEEIAKAAGVKIKSVAHISFTDNMITPPRPRRGVFMKAMVSSDAAPTTEVTPGEIKIRVEVQGEFEI